MSRILLVRYMRSVDLPVSKRLKQKEGEPCHVEPRKRFDFPAARCSHLGWSGLMGFLASSRCERENYCMPTDRLLDSFNHIQSHDLVCDTRFSIHMWFWTNLQLRKGIWSNDCLCAWDMVVCRLKLMLSCLNQVNFFGMVWIEDHHPACRHITISQVVVSLMSPEKRIWCCDMGTGYDRGKGDASNKSWLLPPKTSQNW